MTPERWHRITTIFHAALARDSDARSTFVAEACGDDSTLRREVESMISAHRRAGTFGEAPTLSPSALEPGASFGPYRIEHRLDAGGMGEVYKARDTRLGRTVALKVVTPALAGDPSFQSRFEREARVISQLDHHHICALYDVGTQDGRPYLVMQYLDGESLAQRLERGAMPVDAALKAAVQIADALDGAHSHGVVHRDLKPANVFLTKSGVKLLDFGLAKSSALVGSLESTAHDTSVTTPGMVLGTVPYMAPEQLEGREADARTDLFALGAVIFEMITGRMAFGGEHQVQVISAIMSADPPQVSTLRAEVPPALDRIVSTCLAKDPEARWQTARDVKRALSWLLEPTTAAGIAVPPRKSGARRLLLTTAALGAVAAVSAIVGWMVGKTAPAPSGIGARSYRFELFPPEGAAFGLSSAALAVSPDGSAVAFHGQNERGESVIWMRRFDAPAARVVPHSSTGIQPFWSPDSRSIGFATADFKLKTVELSSGLMRTLTDSAGGGSWSHEGIILGRERGQGHLSRIAASGGPIVPVTTLDRARGETQHSFPHFLPDGRRFFYHARSNQPEHDGVIYVGSLDSSDRVAVLTAESHAVYVPQGYLLYVRSNTLVAQPFDVDTLRVTGEPVPIADDVEVFRESRRGAFSVSENGVLAFRRVGDTQLTWIDRRGRELESIASPARYANPALSPNQRRLAVARVDPDTDQPDIWVIELVRGAMSRLTVHPAADDMPVWSPDGNRIAFRSVRDRSAGFYVRAADGSGSEETLITGLRSVASLLDWSNDGTALLYSQTDDVTLFSDDLWLLPLAGDRKPIRVVGTKLSDWQGQLSPDGRWIAYTSSTSGGHEIAIRPFPTGEGTWQISTGGGLEPQWRGDGKEIFFLAPDQSLMAVPLTLGTTVHSGAPVRLFGTRLRGVGSPGRTRSRYLPAADGQRFLLNQPRGSASTPYTVVVNWMAALNTRQSR